MNHSVRVSHSIHPQNVLLFSFLPVSILLKRKQQKCDRKFHSRADVFITEFQR